MHIYILLIMSGHVMGPMGLTVRPVKIN